MKRTIVIGDIHGCFDEFLELLLNVNISEVEIVSVGDIVDRGPKSKELYHFFKNRKNAIVLMGNHERKHQKGVLNYAQEIVKLQMGKEYYEFVKWTKDLDYFYETEDAIIVHAAFEEGKKLNTQKEEVLSGTTSGAKYLEQKYGKGKYWTEFYTGKKPIIYGHHVVGDKVKIINNTYGIDTGACHGNFLTAIELPSFKIHQIKVEKDYWKEEMVKWQVPVFKAKPWKEMSFHKIEQQIKKFRRVENKELQLFLDALESWLSLLDFLLEKIKTKLEERATLILKEYKNSGFNLAASQYPFKVFLF